MDTSESLSARRTALPFARVDAVSAHSFAVCACIPRGLLRGKPSAIWRRERMALNSSTHFEVSPHELPYYFPSATLSEESENKLDSAPMFGLHAASPLNTRVRRDEHRVYLRRRAEMRNELLFEVYVTRAKWKGSSGILRIFFGNISFRILFRRKFSARDVLRYRPTSIRIAES